MHAYYTNHVLGDKLHYEKLLHPEEQLLQFVRLLDQQLELAISEHELPGRLHS